MGDFLNDYALEVLEQYDFEVYRTWKGRGVYFADTSEGIHVIKEHRSSDNRR